MKRIIAWLPDRVDTRLKVIAWVYLVGQVVLVGTGGLVRLTASGLGCPTWPKCTADSLVNTPEMGVHGFIEFGNRVLSALLAVVAIVAFLAILRMRKQRPDLFWLTLIAGLAIPAQAVIGGLSVLSGLNPYVVGLHFVVSIALVATCTAFVFRVYAVPGPRVRAVPGWFAGVAHVTSAVVAITILVGILTTGSGPHAGDANAPRNGLNPEILQHVHAIPAYVTFALTLVLVVGSLRYRTTAVRRFTQYLLAVELLQIVVGLIQANTGLPGILVGIHMTLAALLASAMTAVILSLKAPAAALDAREDSAADVVAA
ncbi:cytochrome c oxidase assembly protein subunit 15 [Leifsonia sp. 98AMF]|uniref:COX15/CtaA family protein n=1 Tax=unclassified Leifsonia TaxID=2663824 RepID=UPI0003681315|nr:MULTISPECIES: COX15/CtaA family protein [unclassified Leifsonia]TDP99963.1 cytochrome c oxidase assembly protein subunit 15 [Leifsonia sp. 115AMFTsu3.1]SDH37476.1 cytochrome c oxidase assembly protein subunit 15 [Leifsonia sp. 197AMF]SDI98387.1 cytochrome c oxidase assembly protein subunit 15 [Leifsonia sp. 466MF]SDJ76438.1 cytochrome c oxidase assembly protein subunit 15 [Leifsonia sp. 157MF]SDO01708.1 cytochrome c oxidase assembly protein subunit 15 [Leifsonia sp. 509MF]